MSSVERAEKVCVLERSVWESLKERVGLVSEEWPRGSEKESCG